MEVYQTDVGVVNMFVSLIIGIMFGAVWVVIGWVLGKRDVI